MAFTPSQIDAATAAINSAEASSASAQVLADQASAAALAASTAATAAVTAAQAAAQAATSAAQSSAAADTALASAKAQRVAGEAVINQIVAEYRASLTVVTPPPVVDPPPVVIPPVGAITSYPKRTTVVGASGTLAVYSEGMTVPGFGKITNGVLTIPDANAILPANITIKGAIVHTGGGTLTAANVREEGGYGHESYWRTISGVFNLTSCSAIRTGNSGLGSSVSHGYFAGQGAHSLMGCYVQGAQTGFALGGGPDVNHPRLLLGCKAAELRQVGTGHCESEFVGITGAGYFKSQFCHWEPSSRCGWQTAAAFMQPAPGECWWELDSCFLAGQNIDLYIQSAFKSTPSAWTPAAPPQGHPGHLTATNNDFGPQTSPSASWHTYLKSAFGEFTVWTNNGEVDVNYKRTGKMINALASFKDVDSAGQNPTLTRVD